MAKATTLIDDMDGESTGASERHFSIGGMDYAIDLTDDNYRALLLTMEPWRSAARVARKPRKQAHRPLTPEERKAIRSWAKSQGITLAKRGRFPNDVVAQFFKEQEADEYSPFDRDDPRNHFSPEDLAVLK